VSLVAAALRRLPTRDQTLLTLLMDSPSPSYSQLSAELSMAVGSIGPSRARSLGRLRRELTPPGSTATWSAPNSRRGGTGAAPDAA
jgi:hypothetical protein